MTLTVLVTGASGFVGQHLVQHLKQTGCRVTAASRRSIPGEPELQQLRMPDLTSERKWTSLFPKSYDVVVHLAGRVHVMRDDQRRAEVASLSSNTEATATLAAAARDAGVGRFVYMSSIKVYGDGISGHPIRADDSARPADPYGRSKLLAEKRLKEICAETGGMEAVVLRPPLVYGPGVKANFREMMRWVRSGVPLPLGAVSNRRSMIYVKNLCALVATSMVAPTAVGRTFLASDGQDMSTTALLTSIAHAMEKPVRLVPVPVPLLRMAARMTGRAAIATRLLDDFQVDLTDTTQTLDWRPPVSWEDGIVATVREYVDSGAKRGASN